MIQSLWDLTLGEDLVVEGKKVQLEGETRVFKQFIGYPVIATSPA